MESKSLNIGIAGSGAMGSGIAQVAATSGCKVFLFDPNEQALKRAQENLNKTLTTLEEKGKLNEPSAKVFERIVFTQAIKDFSSSHLIIEAIIEDLRIKQELFSQIESLVSDSCIIASNTSSLSIASLASVLKKPERFVGIHFFNPAPLMPLVEIIAGVATSDITFTTARQIIDGWGKTTVNAKDTPGFIVNRIARPFYGEAIKIYEEGIASKATIDWAMREVGKFRMGPFELMDFIGNDVNYKVTETVWQQFFYDPRYKPSLTQKRLYEAGFFGKKTGRGHYNYSSGKIEDQPENDIVKCQLIFNRILAMLINEAVDALYLNISTKEELDLAMTKGVNYPKGLLKWADEIGLENVLKTLNDLADLYEEDRYRPSVLLKRMVKEGKKFYQ